MDESYFLGAALGVILMATLGWIIGDGRDRPGAGFLCGFLLGPLGVVLALFLPKGEEKVCRKPGAPVARERRVPVKADPIEEFEARERAKQGFAPVVVPLRRAKMNEDE